MAKHGKFEECPFCQIDGHDYDKLIEKDIKKWSLRAKEWENFHFETFVVTFNEKSFVIADKVPKTKGHMMIITRKHYDTAEGMASEDWNSFLPLLKEVIGKIKKTYSPIGFDLHCYNGTKKFQSVPHFHWHIAPIYKKEYGRQWLVKRVKRHDESDQFAELAPSPQEYQEAKEKLESQPGTVSECSKVIAQLAPQKENFIQGHIIIKPKKSIPNDINAIDEQIWEEMGELLQECIQKTKKLGMVDFTFHIGLGEMTGPNQESLPETQLHFFPFKDVKYTNVSESSTREYKRIIDKCLENRNNEKEKKQLSLWKQPATYLALASGFFLGLGIYWLIRRKNKK